jgi:hypothetical protein
MECEFTEISSEEEAELQRSTKKVKETPFAPHAGSYRDKLVGEIPGAFLHAFALDRPTFSQDEIGEEEDDVQAVVDGIGVLLTFCCPRTPSYVLDPNGLILLLLRFSVVRLVFTSSILGL